MVGMSVPRPGATCPNISTIGYYMSMGRSHAVLMATLMMCCLTSFAAATRPNVVFILADDLGYGDLGCYGHPYAKTPNLDRLAGDGTRFMQFYATGVTCCPARTGLMTGKFPATFARYPASFGFGDRVTVTELLKASGYATGHFGKWHIGPIATAGTYGIDAVGAGDHSQGGKRRLATGCRDTPIYDQAIRFVEDNRDRPFYVNVWDHIPHHPVNPSQALLDAFGPLDVDEARLSASVREKFTNCRARGGDAGGHLRAWLAEIQAMDAEVGRLLRRIDALGLRDRTIIVFSSDQGPAPLAPPEPMASDGKKPQKLARSERKEARTTDSGDAEDLRLNAMGCVGPLRGGKHTQLEGGVRVPFIVRWPGRVPAGRVDDRSVISGADWLPTLCALAGVTIDAADFDGEDVSAAWLGEAPHARAKPLFWKTSSPNSDPSMRSEAWKFHAASRRRGEAALYDLGTDPGEASNLAAQQPEVFARLTAKLKDWTATLPKAYDHGDAKED